MQSKSLSADGFVKATRKALLRNTGQVNWVDFSMILLVAEKLDFSQVEDQRKVD